MFPAVAPAVAMVAPGAFSFVGDSQQISAYESRPVGSELASPRPAEFTHRRWRDMANQLPEAFAVKALMACTGLTGCGHEQLPRGAESGAEPF